MRRAAPSLRRWMISLMLAAPLGGCGPDALTGASGAAASAAASAQQAKEEKQQAQARVQQMQQTIEEHTQGVTEQADRAAR